MSLLKQTGLFVYRLPYIVDKIMGDANGYYKDIDSRLDLIDSKLDQTLDNLSNKVEILGQSIDRLTHGIADFKSLFYNAVPLRVVIIVLLIVAAIFGLTKSLVTQGL